MNELIQTYEFLQQELALAEDTELPGIMDSYTVVVNSRLPILNNYHLIVLGSVGDEFTFKGINDEDIFDEILGYWTDIRVALKEQLTKKGLGNSLEKAINFFEQSYQLVLDYEKKNIKKIKEPVKSIEEEIKEVVNQYLEQVNGLEDFIVINNPNKKEQKPYPSHLREQILSHTLLSLDEIEKMYDLSLEDAMALHEVFYPQTNKDDVFRENDCQLIFYQGNLVAEVNPLGKVKYPLIINEDAEFNESDPNSLINITTCVCKTNDFAKKAKELGISPVFTHYGSDITKLNKILQKWLRCNDW